DSIESQIKELAELSLVQQRFVSDVSHELRTPLTTIRLASDMLNDQRDRFDGTTARAAELLHAQVQRFEVLLTDLLEISRYDAGSVQLENE
ncbi:histidine kinase dimerization/phospho-acceptor domain-containing protein, partial [Streptomyces brasiliscabiei]